MSKCKSLSVYKVLFLFSVLVSLDKMGNMSKRQNPTVVFHSIDMFELLILPYETDSFVLFLQFVTFEKFQK